jgi:hypothetical protein
MLCAISWKVAYQSSACRFENIFKFFFLKIASSVFIVAKDYLLLEEKNPPVVMKRPHISQCGVWLDKVSIRWPTETERNTLSDISVSVKPGHIVAIVGSVGAGKVQDLNLIRLILMDPKPEVIQDLIKWPQTDLSGFTRNAKPNDFSFRVHCFITFWANYQP